MTMHTPKVTLADRNLTYAISDQYPLPLKRKVNKTVYSTEEASKKRSEAIRKARLLESIFIDMFIDDVRHFFETEFNMSQIRRAVYNVSCEYATRKYVVVFIDNQRDNIKIWRVL